MGILMYVITSPVACKTIDDKYFTLVAGDKIAISHIEKGKQVLIYKGMIMYCDVLDIKNKYRLGGLN